MNGRLALARILCAPAFMIAAILACAPAGAQAPDEAECLSLSRYSDDIPHTFVWGASPLDGADQFEEPIAACKRLIATAQLPDTTRARMHATLGMAIGSEADLGEAARLDPTSPLPHVYRAWFKVAGFHLDDAVDELTAAARLASRPATIIAWRGLLRLGKSMFKDQPFPTAAVADAEQALALEPDNADALLLRGYLFLRAGARDRAVADLTRYLDLGHRHFAALTGRGDAHVLLGRREEALRDYRAALEVRLLQDQRTEIEKKIAALRQ